MTLKVIGAGFGRTGTLSLKLALEKLGFGPCHHMMEVFGKPDHIALWQAAADGESVDWDQVFNGYNSAVDWPVCAFWRELSVVYPDAKFILSRRDANKWFDSASETIFKAMSMFDGKDVHGKMTNTLVVNHTFGGNLTDRQHAIDIYEKHNQAVEETLPAERLLIFEAAQGWQPLCDFLDVPVPEEDYPRTNSTEEFQKMAQLIRDNQKQD